MKSDSRPTDPQPLHKRKIVRNTLIAIGVMLLALLAYTDYTVTSRFEGQRWQIPARVYARPLELTPGRGISMDELSETLARTGYRQVSGPPQQPGQFSKKGNSLLVYTRSFDFGDAREAAQQLRIAFYGHRIGSIAGPRGGPALRQVRLEPEEIGVFYPKIQEDRILVKREQIPKTLVQAILATEDRRFYEHHGIDPRGIARALFHNAQAGRTVEGGSTLTQQLVKNFYLSGERSLTRKLREAFMSLLLELHYDKDEILEAYLNEIYLGQDGNRSVHGVGLASKMYFGTDISQIDLPQAALLAGLIQGPNLYNPFRNPGAARKRRNEVLDKLADMGFVPQHQADALKAAPLGVVKTRQALGPTPAFLDLVRRQLRQHYDQVSLTADGLRIFTTLDVPSQRALEQALSHRLPMLEQQRSLPSGSLQGAGLVVHPGSGEVLALVGDREPGYAGFNRALDALRQVGSLIKPAVYLTALSRPQQYTLASFIEDSPFSWEVKEGPWQPENYDRRFRGSVMLAEALADSLNVPTARLGQAVGLDSVIKTARALGVTHDLPLLPATLLGAAEMTPIEVGQMYQSIANGGIHVPIHSIRSVYTADGKALPGYPAAATQAADPRYVYLLNHALQRALTGGTAMAVGQYVPIGPGLAGKTGTTNDLRDSWFSGFSPDWLGVVWVGRDDNTPAGLSGSQGALHVWGDMAQRLRISAKPFPRPDGIDMATIDPDNGLQPGANCLPQPAPVAPTQSAADPATPPEAAATDVLMGPPAPPKKYRSMPFITGSVPAVGEPCEVANDGNVLEDVIDTIIDNIDGLFN